MKQIVLIVLICLIGLNYVNTQDDNSSISRLFDRKTYEISVYLGMIFYVNCHEKGVEQSILDTLETESAGFSTCYHGVITDIKARYEPTTRNLTEVQLMKSPEFYAFMCEFYKRTHTCAKDFVPLMYHCVKEEMHSNTYRFAYQAAKYGLDYVCDDNAEVFSIFTTDPDACINFYIKKLTPKYNAMLELNEPVLFTTPESCRQLLDARLSVEESQPTECSDENFNKIKAASSAIWKASCCQSVDNENKI